MKTIYEIKSEIGRELETAGVSNPYHVADLIENITDIKLQSPAKDEIDKIGQIIGLLASEDGAVRRRVLDYVDSWLDAHPYIYQPSNNAEKLE